VTHPPLRPAAQAREHVLPGKSRHTRWPWVVAGLLVVIALGTGAYAMGGAGEEPAASLPAAPSESTGGGGAGGISESGTDLGLLDKTVVADGVFVITVNRVRCGVKEVGPDELRQPAKGEFCLADVSAENAGREAQLLDGSIQRVVDARGRAYAVDEQAAALLNDQSPTLLEEIAPGATVRGVLPFDVPAGSRPSALVLHESVQSRGARVSLS
jgi:uncharacterized protein DUF4352